MNSTLFKDLGIDGVDPGYIILGLTVVLLIVIILLIVQISKTSKLQKKYAKFMRGKDAKSLEKEIVGLYEDNRFLKTTAEKNKSDIKNIYKRLESAFQKVGLVKYDAFQQMGGQLSFSLAVLDENDNGFIMNSVHSAEGCYSYTKEIKQGQCSLTLGDEEKMALDMAMAKP